MLFLPLSPLTLAVGSHPVHETAPRPLVDDHLAGVVAPYRRDVGDLDGTGSAAPVLGDDRPFETNVVVANDAVPAGALENKRIALGVPDEHTVGLGAAHDDTFDVGC